MDWDILNCIRASCFQGSIKNPDKQVAFSQISFYEAESWCYDWFNINKEVTWKNMSMSMMWSEMSSIEFEQPINEKMVEFLSI